MPERDECEDEYARDEHISPPSERNIDVSIRALSAGKNRSLAVQSPDNPKVITSMPAFPKTEC